MTAALVLAACVIELRRRLGLVARAEHELRGPVAVVSLAAERMRREPAGRRYAVALDAELERLRAGLADLAAARAGRRRSRRPRRSGSSRSCAAAWRRGGQPGGQSGSTGAPGASRSAPTEGSSRRRSATCSPTPPVTGRGPWSCGPSAAEARCAWSPQQEATRPPHRVRGGSRRGRLPQRGGEGRRRGGSLSCRPTPARHEPQRSPAPGSDPSLARAGQRRAGGFARQRHRGARRGACRPPGGRGGRPARARRRLRLAPTTSPCATCPAGSFRVTPWSRRRRRPERGRPSPAGGRLRHGRSPRQRRPARRRPAARAAGRRGGSLRRRAGGRLGARDAGGRPRLDRGPAHIPRAPGRGARVDPGPAGEGAADSVATLRVTLRQAVYLTAAENFAREVRLLARPPGDRERDDAAEVAAGEL